MNLSNMLEPNPDNIITSFSGQNAWLSNMAIVGVIVDNVTYCSVEHGYVASKTIDPKIRTKVAAIADPRKAKKFGRTFDLRPDWEQIKLDVMRDLVRQKFPQPRYRSLLLATGDKILIEGNWWGDRFWGVSNGRGENHLGRIIMDIRSELAAQKH